jgi:small-conductance mechanosensitive channel
MPLAAIHGAALSALITFGATLVVAFVVDRLVIARGGRVASRFGTEVKASRSTQTRMRVVRRLLLVGIVVIGGALALSKFANFERLAAGILASSAVLTLVLGLAARQVFANPMAGLMIAITQPIRIGDSITIDDVTGRVDDLTLSYTYIDTGDGRLMIVPNEQVVSSIVFNRSTGDRDAPAAASVWLPVGASVATARKALEEAGVAAVEVAELSADGVRLDVHEKREAGHTKTGAEEAALRERAHQALLAAGVLTQAA